MFQVISRDSLTPEDIGVELTLELWFYVNWNSIYWLNCNLGYKYYQKCIYDITYFWTITKLHNIQDHERHKAMYYNHTCLHYYNISTNFVFIYKFGFCHWMIFTSRHLGFFRIRHIGMTQYLYKWFRSIFSSWKYRCRHQNYDSMSIRSRNIAQIRFSWWPKPISCTKVDNANNIPRKPLIQIKSGGGAWWPNLAHGLPVSIINQDINKNKIC